MSELMKRRHTENIREVKFRGPPEKIRELADFAKKLGLTYSSMAEPEELVPWRDAFPEITDVNLPAACLRGQRYKQGITQRQLSEMTGIPLRHISEMENSKRPIGKMNARLFAKALNTRYKVFL